MLEAEVVHDIKKNYLVIQGTEEKQYMIQMLDGNSVKGLLELDVRILDNKRQYYYDITGKETLVQKSSKAKWKNGMSFRRYPIYWMPLEERENICYGRIILY